MSPPPADFVVFILTHGRPDRVYTLKSLSRFGYTGPVYLVVDDEDATRAQYVERFGKQNVLTFSKREIARTFDEADNFDDRRTIVYARNACFELAKKLGYTYFLQLDDDYTDFRYKLNDENEYVHARYPKDLNAIFSAFLDFYKATPATAIAMAQGGDFIGGAQNQNARFARLTRKLMNTIFCSTKRPFQFVGRINEDVNTYTSQGRLGKLFLTVPLFAIQQKQTQTNAGGMTDIYLDSGTYVKSYYSVMLCPSSVRIGMIQDAIARIHHKVSWRYTVPQILSADLRKAS